MVASAFTARLRLMNILCEDNAKLDSRIRRTPAYFQYVGYGNAKRIRRTIGHRVLVVRPDESVVETFLLDLDSGVGARFLSVIRDCVHNEQN